MNSFSSCRNLFVFIFLSVLLCSTYKIPGTREGWEWHQGTRASKSRGRQGRSWVSAEENRSLIGSAIWRQLSNHHPEESNCKIPRNVLRMRKRAREERKKSSDYLSYGLVLFPQLACSSALRAPALWFCYLSLSMSLFRDCCLNAPSSRLLFSAVPFYQLPCGLSALVGGGGDCHIYEANWYSVIVTEIGEFPSSILAFKICNRDLN